MRLKIFALTTILAISTLFAQANTIFIAMDNTQSNHLKAYGIAYWIIDQGVEVDWLLNYKGGSFMMDYFQKIENELIIRGADVGLVVDGRPA